MIASEDIGSWLNRNQFNEALSEVLIGLGVDSVEDLQVVDDQMLPKVKAVASPSEFERFVAALKRECQTPTTDCNTSLTASSEQTNAAAPNIYGAEVLSAIQNLSAGEFLALKKRKVAPSSSNSNSNKACRVSSLTSLGNTELATQIQRLELDCDAQVLEKREKDKKKERDAAREVKMTVKRNKLIYELVKDLKKNSTIDVAFCFDVTASMGNMLRAAKGVPAKLIAQLRSVCPDLKLRVALVSYRDFGDAKRLTIMPFTANEGTLQAALSRLRANGGGDMPEDVLGALNAVVGLNWTAQKRILFHIGDSPCHGREFHNGHDDYPDGDPDGLEAETVLRALHHNGVEYLFGRQANDTDIMLEQFNRMMGFEYVREHDVNDKTMVSVVVSTVSSSLAASLSSSSSTDTAAVKLKAVHIVKRRPPLYDSGRIEQASRYAMTEPPATLDELLAVTTNRCLEPFPALVSLRVAQYPFAKGTVKAAYYAYDCDDGRDVVVKESRAVGAAHLTKAKYEAALSCVHAASCLAALFNKKRPRPCERIALCAASLVHFPTREEEPYFIEEDELPAERFEKYNTNNGVVVPSPTILGTKHDAVQAFSHWTHSVTGGAMMVVDCQGVFDRVNNTFRLTDPAIHCTALTRFGGTNLGRIGFERFYKTHRCNAYCRKLALTIPVEEKDDQDD